MRLIDADALMDDVMENGVLKSDKYGIVLDFGAVAAINNAPTIDAEPVRNGRWVDEGEGAYLCSECGLLWLLNDGTPEQNSMNYCPNCGAKMDLKEDDHAAD